MGTFKSERMLYGDPKYIPDIGNAICESFKQDGFEVVIEELVSGGVDISLSKGNMFKAIIGMKSALKVNIVPKDGNIFIKAGVGIFGQQAVPTIVTLALFWPLIITQVWGIVRQSKLDDRAVEIAQAELSSLQCMELQNSQEYTEVPDNLKITDTQEDKENSVRFCTSCGTKTEGDSKFCPNCGAEL